jgi:hypothetical protein
LSSYIEGNCYEHDMRVENWECGVEFAGAEPRKIWLSTNQSPGISPGREPEATEHGCPIAARHDGITGGVAEHLMTPVAAEVTSHRAPTVSLSIKSVAARAGVKPRRYDEIPTTASHAKRRRNPPFDATKGGRSSPLFGREGDELSPFP